MAVVVIGRCPNDIPFVRPLMQSVAAAIATINPGDVVEL
jgi:hypothetical protein